jgi:hypothetical protein
LRWRRNHGWRNTLQWTTVKNGAIRGFGVGINLGSSARNTIRDLEVSDAGYGLVLGPRSLVKGCLIESNRQDGINIGYFGQVQDCTIGDAPPNVGGGNGGNGIFGGIRMLITNNTVVGNQSGILVGDFSTVSFNTSSANTVYGVLAFGTRTLITGNTTNDNGNAEVATGGLSSVSSNISNDNVGGGIGVGVEASCPSTVTNNKSSGNSLLNYNIGKDIIGTGCQTNNNK